MSENLLVFNEEKSFPNRQAWVENTHTGLPEETSGYCLGVHFVTAVCCFCQRRMFQPRECISSRVCLYLHDHGCRRHGGLFWPPQAHQSFKRSPLIPSNTHTHTREFAPTFPITLNGLPVLKNARTSGHCFV